MGVTIELIKLCQQGKTDAQMQLYRLCYPRLLGVCRRYENRDHDAGALFNSGFFKVLKGLPGHEFQSEEGFMLWARRVIINDMIDMYRRTRKHHALNVAADFSVLQLEHSSTDLNTAALDLDAEYLMELINSLPEIQRQVFNLHAIDDYPHKEIAKILGMTEGTSKWYLSEARKTLRKKLAAIEKKNISKIKI
jgi:RNA polymerase sigma-70 factor (ECF subfamily)